MAINPGSEKRGDHIHRIGIVFSGGPAPASNAVISSAATSLLEDDRQIWQRPNVRYGEAVGFTYSTQNEPPRLATSASRIRETRLFGQVEWPYGGSDDRSGRGNLRQ